VYAYAARQAVYTAVIVLGSLVGARIDGTLGVAYAVVGGVVVNYVLMTRLAGRLAAVSMADLLRIHLPGSWVALWIGIFLWGTLPILRVEGIVPWQTLTLAASGSLVVGISAWFLSGPLTTKSYTRAFVESLMRKRRAVVS
jgi:hypothetical protein